jgi:lipid-binding SYLF domain-containing protein
VVLVDYVLNLSDVVELVIIFTLGLIIQVMIGCVLTDLVVLPDRERVETFETARTVTAGTKF